MAVDSPAPALLPSAAMKRLLLHGVVCLVLLGLCGCGYRLGETRAAWLDKEKTLYIPVFSNESLLPGLELPLTDAARELFTLRAAFAPAARREDAELLFRGVILEARETPSVLSTGSDGPYAASMELTLRVRLSLLDRDGVELWGAEWHEKSEFSSSGALMRMEENRDEAAKRLAKRLMSRAYEELMEGF